MTDVQFEKLMNKLEEINQNVKLITFKTTNKEVTGLELIYSELCSVTSNLGDVETAVKEVSSAVKNIN